MILLVIFTFLIQFHLAFTDSIAYTVISRTNQHVCLNSCTNGKCAINAKLTLEDCKTNNLPAPRYHTSLYRGSREYCLSNCHNYDEDYLWCYTTENYHWDYCSYSTSRQKTYDYLGKVCKTPCEKKDGVYKCNSDTGYNTLCALSATVPSSNCYNLLFKNNARVLRQIDSDGIYNFNDHRLVHPTSDNFVVDTADQLERQYGTTHVNIAGNPVTQYTTRTVNQGSAAVILPLVVRAVIDRGTVRDEDRTSSAISGAARRNFQLMTAMSNGQFDTGHLIGFQNGGPSDVLNFAPQTVQLNRGPWRRTEDYINQWCHYGGSVDMTVVVFYEGASTIPDSFGLKLVFYEPNSGAVHADCIDTVYRNANQ